MHHHHPQADRWRHCGPGWTYALALLITAAVLSAGPEAALAQCQYEVTAIIEGPPGCPFGENAFVFPQDMNDSGEVVGYLQCPASTPEFAFRWSAEGGLETLQLPVPGLISSRAQSINNNGDICGWYVVYDADKHDYWGASYVLKNDGKFISIPVPEGGTHIEAHAINDSGQVCGWWADQIDGDPPGGAFIWENGDLQTIDPPDTYVNLRGFDLNEQGQVTGWTGAGPLSTRRAFIWDENLILLTEIPKGINSDGRAINSSSKVAGKGSLGGGISHGYAATVDSAEDLGVLPESDESWARAIHDNGLIVGFSANACLWHNGEIYGLNDLIIEPDAGILKEAYAINGQGEILVQASASGTVGYILTPAEAVAGDISGDCSVDVVDLLTLLENWSAEDSFADIDEDGIVGVSDLLMLLADWNQ